MWFFECDDSNILWMGIIEWLVLVYPRLNVRLLNSLDNGSPRFNLVFQC